MSEQVHNALGGLSKYDKETRQLYEESSKTAPWLQREVATISEEQQVYDKIDEYVD